MKRIICFHLFNDYSGSPKVLQMVLDGLCKDGIQVELVTSKTNGVLDQLKRYPNFKMRTYSYQFSNYLVMTMVRYSRVQLLTFFIAMRYIFCKETVFYINTLLPAGPALAGRLMGKRVVYHYHENASFKGLFYKMLACIMEKLAHTIICVSKYQASYIKNKKKIHIIPNALPALFLKQLVPSIEKSFAKNQVLMVGSLKRYKGTMEFLELANRLSNHKFCLVLNESQENIDSYLRNNGINPFDNVKIYPRQSDVASFYNNSSIVLNLTNKEMAVETFGLTALEAMSAGLPVIVPTVGGIAEMVEDNKNGFKIDVQNLDEIAERIERILSDKQLYTRLATCALEISTQYHAETMVSQIKNIVLI